MATETTLPLAWDVSDVASITGGVAFGNGKVGGVVIDSRQSGPDTLFAALAGQRVDGHDFASDAVGLGAVALVDAARRMDIVPRVEVDDVATALLQLAVARRSELACRVIAITGSTGKTSTKDLTAAAVGPNSWASPRSFNNEIGVPLTILSTPDDADVLVAEVGSRAPGDIRRLVPAVSPDVAVITNIGQVHLETFGSQDALARAKWELVEGLPEGGIAVLPFGEGRLPGGWPDTVTFGSHPEADVGVSHVEIDGQGRPSFELTAAGETVPVKLAIAGYHQATNAAAAVAASLALGRPLAQVAAALAKAVGSPWRMEVHEGYYTVVNDSYNANPTSTESALRTVAAMGSKRIAVLGLMAELGDVSESEHRRIGRLTAELGYDLVVVVGEDHGIAAGAGSIARPAATGDEAVATVSAVAEPGAVILVKGSRIVGLESVARQLEEGAR
ncbi:MAG: UDP-N-acetylmuramoyl-tripeptide--D-alanyl-D-alanine ligase [Acidimicrobiia bacterium]|nr:UDP-N-acetylmuramoyl-tripeptide--D-alanyl-D-alanine ligase [Acidimicrobiia bacterium]